jgi:hypothetical protein
MGNPLEIDSWMIASGGYTGVANETNAGFPETGDPRQRMGVGP